MSTSQAVLQQLPYLRRYARALSGSQASGDAYVAATLESLIASPQILGAGTDSRVALYRLFTKIWNSVAVNGKPEAGGAILPPEQHLTQIAPRPRQAFLLVALEGFSEVEAADVLDCDLPTLRGLVEESGRELAAEIATDVLIIEDETFIAMDIEALVESLGHNVIGVARTHAEAIALARKKRPGLILADIQLADGSSGPRCRERASRLVGGAGDLYHRLPGAFPHRAAAGAGVPHCQALPARGGVGRGEPGAVLRAQGTAARAAADRAAGDAVRRRTNLCPGRSAARSGALQGPGIVTYAETARIPDAVHRHSVSKTRVNALMALHRIRETPSGVTAARFPRADHPCPFRGVGRDHGAQRAG